MMTASATPQLEDAAPVDIRRRYEATPTERDLILGDMRAWMAGRPVLPYADILARWGAEFEMYRHAWHNDRPGRYDRSAALFSLRWSWVAEFGFAIPCAELLDALAQHQPINEIGAGSGYMTALMRARAIDVIGTDRQRQRYPFKFKHHDPMQLRLDARTVVLRYPARTVFCSWPSFGRTWFRQALQVMRVGQRVILVREESCAEESTWSYLDRYFDQEADIRIPAWPHMNDSAEVWVKVGKKVSDP
jgi:hypothetical protein